MEVLELDSLSQLMAGSVTNVDSNADIEPVVEGGNEPPRAKETGDWSYGWE